MKHSRPTRVPRRLIVATPVLAAAAAIAGPMTKATAETKAAKPECLADLWQQEA